MSEFEQVTSRSFRYCTRSGVAGLCSLILLASSPIQADGLMINVHGLKGALSEQVMNRVQAHNVIDSIRFSARQAKQTEANARLEVESALRPFGYYHPEVTSQLIEKSQGTWELDLQIDPGPPVIISSSVLEITGEGAGLKELDNWKNHWPLGVGKILDQTLWDAQKENALELAEADGYLSAEFTQHTINADLDNNEASTILVLDTGPQAVVGVVLYQQDAVSDGILELLPRFKEGQAYDSWLLEKFRLDLWRTGYFQDVEIVEERRLEESPPVVNFIVKATPRKPNTYQGSLGYGTDTDVRVQVLWTRHLLSSRGDSLDTGMGWQQFNNEYSFRSNYRLPRKTKARQFWIAEAFIRRENQDFEVSSNDIDTDSIKLTTGNVVDYAVKAGNLVVRDLNRGYQQLFETWYGQYLLEKTSFNLENFFPEMGDVSQLDANLDPFRKSTTSLSLGVNWDWPVISGSAFGTYGHHERAWIFTSNKVIGSDLNFSQVYLSSNWTKMISRKLKILLRGEAGYSDARVRDLEVDLRGPVLQLSVTDLPNLYRFKAGGSGSVRGYAFESLSNNGIGSNNMVSASSEIEWNFRPNWALAAFVDAGNAFNDWNDMDIKVGWGAGIRWYSIVGPIRVDIAQALDLDGQPWRLHFTIGTPLL